MTTGDILEFGVLLAPIDGDNPAGTDLRIDAAHDSLYLKVKDARAAARAAERQADGGGEGDNGSTAWRTILTVAPDLLALHSKDLEVASWLVEALVREGGFAGLRDGFKLLRGLIRDFWEGLYPLEDEDGLETKIAPLVGLFGEGPNSPLCQALRKVDVTIGQDPGPFASWHYDAAVDVDKTTDETKKQRKIDAGAPTLADFTASFRVSGKAFVRSLAADLDGARSELEVLGNDLYARCGADAPGTANVRDVIENIVGLVRHLGGDLLAEEATADIVSPNDGGAVSTPLVAGETAGRTASGPIASRDQALRTLQEVAEYFRRTEPQSFIPLMLDNVVRRGRMTLIDLLADLVPDPAVRETLFTRAGVPPAAEETASGGW